MLRGMSLAGSSYPFASLDSTDIARNHNRPHNRPKLMAERWDAQQCPAKWAKQPTQQLFDFACDPQAVEEKSYGVDMR